MVLGIISLPYLFTFYAAYSLYDWYYYGDLKKNTHRLKEIAKDSYVIATNPNFSANERRIAFQKCIDEISQIKEMDVRFIEVRNKLLGSLQKAIVLLDRKEYNINKLQNS
jgi:hypothetical protein